MPTARITFGNSPLPTGISLSRGQSVVLDFYWRILDCDNLDINNLSGVIVQPSGQVVRELTRDEISSIEANEQVQGWMHERVHELTTDDRGP